MLFKSILHVYGRSLLGQPMRPDNDLVAAVTSPEARDAFRRQAVEDISAAHIYVLDPEAANYADSFRNSMQGGRDTAGKLQVIKAFMREVALPADLVWVEYDHAALLAARLTRGHKMASDTGLHDFGPRGFLFDNRSPDHLKLTPFRTDGRQRVTDPIAQLIFPKDPRGLVIGETFQLITYEHMIEFLQAARVSREDAQEMQRQEHSDASYDMVLGYALFALIASRENGLLSDERPTLSRGEEKTARKFGKTWITKGPPSFYTIRIGPEARAHLSEQTARRAAEKEAHERNSPIRHHVSEHERRYKSGKIVKVSAHYRGQDPVPGIPILVKGPRAG